MIENYAKKNIFHNTRSKKNIYCYISDFYLNMLDVHDIPTNVTKRTTYNFCHTPSAYSYEIFIYIEKKRSDFFFFFVPYKG